MREILFRGMHYRDGWVYGYYVKRGKLHIIVTNEYGDMAVDPATVGQWTGLVDQDGRKIFEHDRIVCAEYADVTVYFADGSFCVRVSKDYFPDLWNFDEKYTKVIGTIHDTEVNK